MSELINLNTPNYEGDKSLLERLLEDWFGFRNNDVIERSCQTDFEEPIEKKLDRINQKYASKIDYSNPTYKSVLKNNQDLIN